MLSLLRLGDVPGKSRTAGYAVMSVPAVVLCLLFVLVLADGWLSGGSYERGAAADDWPMWRYDAKRGAASPVSLPDDLHLAWVRQLPKPAPAWRQEQYKLQFDRSYEPVVMGKQIFVPSMVGDKVVAYDTETGRQNWQFFANGPVRFAPVAWRDRVYFASDDGCLYCLNAQHGTLLWKSRLAPSDRKVLGNGRLISAWPARGGPVLHDGTLYCSASIWPFMGVFVSAVDPLTGQMIWENSGTGAMYIKQQHGSPAFAGVAPQGYLATDGDKLLATSRTTPACFDCTTGELLYYPLSDRSFGKHVGGYDASIWRQWYFNNGVAYRLSDGKGLGTVSGHVMDDAGVVGIDKAGQVMGYTLTEVQKPNRKNRTTRTEAVAQLLWKTDSDPIVEKIHIRAGNRLYGSGDEGLIAAIEVPDGNEPATVVWRNKVCGRVWNMLAGDRKLFVVTEEGELYCFGTRRRFSRHYPNRALDPDSSGTKRPPDALRRRSLRRNRRGAEKIIEQNSDPNGYCLWLGIGHTRLLMETVRRSQMHVIAIEPDADKVALLRKKLDRAGLYGSRVSVFHGEINLAELPPYIASLIVVEDLRSVGQDAAGSLENLYNLVRPYTGAIWIAAGKGRQLELCRWLANAELPGVRVKTVTGAVVVKRTGPAPGSADWTHQYGDIANTVCSKDRLEPPLGIAWFGEESEFGDVLPRHGHGPPEQIVAGRLYIQGVDSLTARDVYTGRTLWKKPLKADATFGVYYDSSYKHDFRDLSYNQGHLPGANVRGTNFVVTQDRVYIIQEDQCLVLDPRTGQTEQVLVLPGPDGQERRRWAYIGVCGDYLIVGADFVRYTPRLKAAGSKIKGTARFVDWSVSKSLVVMNRYDGRVLWSIDADEGFIHNGIVAGNGKVFCLDTAPPSVMKEAGTASDAVQSSRLLAIDIHTGRVVWENRDCVFGSWLSYSEEFDVLLQAHRKSRDMLWEPGDRMAVFRAETGAILWDRKINHTGPCMLRKGAIFTQESAYDLLTGDQITYRHPLTGEPTRWHYARNYGCGTAIASQNLLTFRSAAAGYYDLASNSGTGNFGGFRSGCTSNLIVADGVLNAPDYTSTCTCSYQNQTSLAMVHMPEVEIWTFSKVQASDAPIRRLGVNFGAPGDRRAQNGTLWLDCPSVGGSSPALDVALKPENPTCFRRHSLRLQGGCLKWVEASGIRGLREVRVKVAGTQDQTAESSDDMEDLQGAANTAGSYTIGLHFVEPEDKEPGQRRFDIALNGQVVLDDFDIVEEAGASNVGIVKTFSGIQTSDYVTVSLTPVEGDGQTILCGIEIVAE